MFDELVKYKVIKDTTDAARTINAEEQMASTETKQRGDYSNIVRVVSNRRRISYDLIVLVYFICVGIDTRNFISGWRWKRNEISNWISRIWKSAIDVVRKDSEEFCLKKRNISFSNRVGSDEEDNESDQEENQDSELETAVSRQEVLPNQNENTSSSESNSNGLGYVIVNRTRSDDTVNESVPDDDEKKVSPEPNLDS